jgi:hypothetical protein
VICFVVTGTGPRVNWVSCEDIGEVAAQLLLTLRSVRQSEASECLYKVKRFFFNVRMEFYWGLTAWLGYLNFFTYTVSFYVYLWYVYRIINTGI